MGMTKENELYVYLILQHYEDLIKKSDFREIEQLQKYLDVLLVIRDKMAAHAPEEEIRSLQVIHIVSRNNLLEINTNSK